uniref:Uncharacterized protein n=1 Tax=Periophthalmus magnuspinnatus TaxID=409849 RepID=A0A3B4AUT8_9GOBI
MEFGERKRSRKSQSFKLLSAEGRCFSGHWVGEEGMEIKRQITGMMKILSDRSGRGYQRVGPGLSQDAGEDGGQSLQLVFHMSCSQQRLMRKMMQAEKGKFTKCTSLHTTSLFLHHFWKYHLHFNLCCLSVFTQTVNIYSTSSTFKFQPESFVTLFFILFQPEVRLVEDYDVFISKAQLDSILINYTRSGSLLFRKLVCVPSLMMPLWPTLCPMGREKEGSMTTEKVRLQYNKKLPGPRDWVQILQDQIKLARRRLRRGQLSCCVVACLNKLSFIKPSKSGM